MNEDDRTLYAELGGEDGLRRLVSRFYHRMDTMPEAAGIRAMHDDLPRAEEKLFFFLSGWTGGPSLYIEKYGHPRLRARHFPFKIGKPERDQWMICMVGAVDDCGLGEPVRSEFLHALLNLADHMRNLPRE